MGLLGPIKAQRFISSSFFVHVLNLVGGWSVPQAANVLATVQREGYERQGKQWSKEDEDKFKVRGALLLTYDLAYLVEGRHE